MSVDLKGRTKDVPWVVTKERSEGRTTDWTKAVRKADAMAGLSADLLVELVVLTVARLVDESVALMERSTAWLWVEMMDKLQGMLRARQSVVMLAV